MHIIEDNMWAYMFFALLNAIAINVAFKRYEKLINRVEELERSHDEKRCGIMENTLCCDCDFCKTDRHNEKGQVRCTRFSQWVDSNQRSCEGYYNSRYLKLFEEDE
jgi:hypothetical protein